MSPVFFSQKKTVISQLKFQVTDEGLQICMLKTYHKEPYDYVKDIFGSIIPIIMMIIRFILESFTFILTLPFRIVALAAGEIAEWEIPIVSHVFSCISIISTILIQIEHVIVFCIKSIGYVLVKLVIFAIIHPIEFVYALWEILTGSVYFIWSCGTNSIFLLSNFPIITRRIAEFFWELVVLWLRPKPTGEKEMMEKYTKMSRRQEMIHYIKWMIQANETKAKHTKMLDPAFIADCNKYHKRLKQTQRPARL